MMKKLLGVIRKELLVLMRDIPSLLFLFIMPVLLVIVISVTEYNVSRRNTLSVLLIGSDSSALKKDIEKGLKKTDYFKIKNINSSGSSVTQKAITDIASGKYQAGIMVSADTKNSVDKRAEEIINICFSTRGKVNESCNKKNTESDISVFFDPAINESLRFSLISSLRGIITGSEMKILAKKYSARMEQDIKRLFKIKMDTLKRRGMSVEMPDFPMKDEIYSQMQKSMEALSDEEITLNIPEFPLESKNVITVNEEYANNGQSGALIIPTVSQTRVPGFTLFAMFFIVIPLTGSIITERNEGAFTRLRTLPVSYLSLLSGKIIVYTVVCMLQCFFMMLIGLYVFPAFFDIPALVMGSGYFAIIVTAIMSSLAAIGFGLLIGTLASSHPQASTFGSLMVVILGILGGVFIPVYLMPDSIRIASAISPLRWGIDSFMDLFARGASIASIFPNLAKLFLFFLVSLAMALYHYSRRK